MTTDQVDRVCCCHFVTVKTALLLYRKPGTQSLALAKKNVEKYYLLVGTTDQLPEFFAVLEKILPKYFKGAYRASIQDGTVIIQSNL